MKNSVNNTTNIPTKNGEFQHLYIKWRGKDALAYLLKDNHNETVDVAVSKHNNLMYDWEAMYNNSDYKSGWINPDFFEIVPINKEAVLHWDAPMYLDEPVRIDEDDPRNDILNRYPYYRSFYNDVEITSEKFGIEIEVININNINAFKRSAYWNYLRFCRNGRMDENGGVLQLYPMYYLNGMYVDTIRALGKGAAECMNCGCVARLLFGDKTMIQVALKGSVYTVDRKIIREVALWHKGMNYDRVPWGDWRSIRTII